MRFVNEWREVPGYAGKYEVSFLGEVRSVFKSGNTRKMTPYVRKRAKGGTGYCVKLTACNGKSKDVNLPRLVYAVWVGPVPEDVRIYHKNGDTSNNHIRNLKLLSCKRLGELTGGKAGRKAVAKIDTSGKVLQIYPCARQAAKANYMSYQAVIDRCYGRVKKEFAVNGISFRYDL